jgi:lipopolysaccharide biosynthesis glycosyltransferase/sulfatase maturation enzyme AslB (radical SAM superfamily)
MECNQEGKIMENDITQIKGYPCPNPFSQLYLVPRKFLDIRFCPHHAPLASIENYEKINMHDLLDFFNTNPKACDIRKKFTSGNFKAAGCHDGCECMSQFNVGGNNFAQEDYINLDGKYQIKTINLSMGPDCNIRCRYCMDPQNFEIDFNSCKVEFGNFIVDFVHNGGHLLFTGGETFLPKWRFVDKLKKLIELGDNKGTIEVFTNATLITEELCDIILRAPFKRFGISMDTSRPELFNYIRKGSDFNQVLKNAKMLLQKKIARNQKYPDIDILSAMSRSTAPHLEETVDFFIGNGFNVSLNILFRAYFSPDFCEEESLDKLSLEELLDVHKQLLSCEEKYGCKLNSISFKGQLLNVIEKKKQNQHEQTILGGGFGHALRKNRTGDKENISFDDFSPAFIENNIPIAVSVNNQYAPILGVMLHSLIETSDPCKNYDILVLCNGNNISPENTRRLTLTVKKHQNVVLRYVNVSRLLTDLSFYIRVNFSIETYFRLFLPQVLPNYKKILYLDADMVVRHDIAELFDIDLEGNFLGAVRDPIITGSQESSVFNTKEYMSKLGIKNAYNYFQAGVLILDLEKLSSISKNMIEYAASNECMLVDQDVLNLFCQGKVKFIDNIWNVDVNTIAMSVIDSAPPDVKKRYISNRENAYIYHFAGDIKPWKDTSHEFANYFWEMARKTCWYEVLLENLIKSNTLAQEKNILDNSSRYHTSYKNKTKRILKFWFYHLPYFLRKPLYNAWHKLRY